MTSSHTAHGTRAGDRNFGLPIWDTLFGTYVMPVCQRREQYGIDEPMPAGYLAQMPPPCAADGTVVPGGDRWIGPAATASPVGPGSGTYRASMAGLVDAFPRYYPSWARPLVRIPGVREVVTWNLAVVLLVR